MDSYKMYWYKNWRGDLNVMLTKPSHEHLIQKVSSFGVPDLRSVRYEYGDKIVNITLPADDVGNVSIIQKIIDGDK
jgi:hypothetical protein